MNGDPIPDSNHIARYCPPGKIDHDPVTMKPIGVSKDNFIRTIKKGILERGISVNWIEKHEKSTINEGLSSIRNRMESYPYKVSDNGTFAVAKVCVIKGAGKKFSKELSVIEDHRPDDDSHALLLGIEIEDSILQQEIALTMDPYPTK